MKDKEENYYRTYKRKGLAEAQRQMQEDVKKSVCNINYTPKYLFRSE